jgi:hypothetical protein
MESVDATQPTVAIEPVGASHPAVAGGPAGGTQPNAGVQTTAGEESCAHCGAPLARDQRYCLECGTPRTYLSGMLLERLRTPAGQAQPGTSGQAPPNGVAPYGTAASSSAWPRSNVLTLIAGIGVLLLAMGVGVLIGRSGGSSSAATPAPQVITVGGGTGGASTGAATTPTTPAETPASTKPSGSGAAAKSSPTKLAPGVGSTPSKPAPPSALKNLHSKSGGSYEQKSKNLPDVVED